MSSDIFVEIDTFLKAIYLGALMCFVYDILRIFRRIRTRGTVAVGIEDIICWFVAAIIMFVFIYKYNNGNIRAYIIVAMVIGIFVYEGAIGKFVVKYLTLLIKKILSLIDNTFGKIFKKALKVLKKCFKPFTILNKKIVGIIKLKFAKETIIKRGADGGSKESKKEKRKKKQTK